MTKPTREELKALLRESHLRDEPTPEAQAAGLDALLTAADAPRAHRPKWIFGLAAVVVALLALTWWTVQPAEQPTASPPPPVVPRAETDAGPPPLEAPEVPDASTPLPLPLPAPRLAPRPQPPAEDPDALAREVALLEQARTQLRTVPDDSLSTLGTYEREFPRGVMRTEAGVLKVEALLRAGRRAEAEALAQKLIARDPDGLVKRRVSKLLDEGAAATE